MSWADRAHAHFLQKRATPTPETPKTTLSGVLGVPTRRILENHAPQNAPADRAANDSPADDAAELAREKFEERAAILEYDAGLSRAETERLAAAEVNDDAAAVPAGDWRAADDAYQAHHFACTACKAAGRGEAYGERCDEGAMLWRRYEAACAAPQPPKPTRAAFVPSIVFTPDEKRRLSIGATADEIAAMANRLDRFARQGIGIDDAERLADKLMLRDRASDAQRMCIECGHLRGGRCGNWRQSGIDEPGRDLLTLLQRCAGFTVNLKDDHHGKDEKDGGQGCVDATA